VQRIFIKKRFLVKRFIAWSRNVGKRFADEDVETEVRKWLRQQRLFYASGLDAPVKRLDTSVSMLLGDVSRNKCFFPGSTCCLTFYVNL
jgi:hypothetical protein